MFGCIVKAERVWHNPSRFICKTDDGRTLEICYKYNYLFAEFDGDIDAIVRIDNVPPEAWANYDYARNAMAEHGIMMPEEES